MERQQKRQRITNTKTKETTFGSELSRSKTYTHVKKLGNGRQVVVEEKSVQYLSQKESYISSLEQEFESLVSNVSQRVTNKSRQEVIQSNLYLQKRREGILRSISSLNETIPGNTRKSISFIKHNLRKEVEGEGWLALRSWKDILDFRFPEDDLNDFIYARIIDKILIMDMNPDVFIPQIESTPQLKDIRRIEWYKEDNPIMVAQNVKFIFPLQYNPDVPEVLRGKIITSGEFFPVDILLLVDKWKPNFSKMLSSIQIPTNQNLYIQGRINKNILK